MNSRRVHELMCQRFPTFSAVAHDWRNIVGTSVPTDEMLQSLLTEYISDPEVIVEVHRKLGAMLPVREAALFISANIGQGQIRVANRDFTSFLVVAQNGVATGWRTSTTKDKAGTS